MISSILNNPGINGSNGVGIGPGISGQSNTGAIDSKQLDQLLALIIAMMLQKQNGQDAQGNNGNGVNQTSKGADQQSNPVANNGNNNGNDITQLLLQIVMQLVMQGLQNQSGQQGGQGGGLSNFSSSV